ncbi:MAG: hypothetical protein ACRDRJ_05075 [Streptosporangiaceae bacterium]
MARHDQRDYRGRFRQVDTDLARDNRSERFPQTDSIDVQTQPESYAYGLVGRDEGSAGARYAAPSMADNFGVTGARLRARRPEMVHPDEAARTVYDVHNEVMRSAARDAGPVDPTYSLVTPMLPHGARPGAEQLAEQASADKFHGLRATSRGEGRSRDR